eukprot:541825_1
MSTKTQQIAKNIKSDRRHRKNMNENEFDSDEEAVMKKLRKMKLEGKDIKQFMFKAIYKLCYDQKENENENNNKNENEKQIKLSQLVNIRSEQMCKCGHG